jgi:hypothetical protein
VVADEGASATKSSEEVIRPKKTELAVSDITLLWIPWIVDSGIAEAAREAAPARAHAFGNCKVLEDVRIIHESFLAFPSSGKGCLWAESVSPTIPKKLLRSRFVKRPLR